MGNNTSTTPASPQQYYNYYGQFCSDSFYLEKNLIHFNYSIGSKDHISNLDPNKLVDIASIIISRPDKLTEEEIIFLLEKLIENYDNEQNTKDNSIVDEHQINKKNISTIDEFCKNCFTFFYLRKNEFSNKKQLPAINIQYFNQPFDFSKISKSLNTILNNSANSSFQDIIETSNTLKSILPVQATIAPNESYFYPKDVDCYSFSFNNTSFSQKFVNNLGPFGLSSNGQFIFLLNSLRLLFVFPILNNGALMPPKLVRLPFQEFNDDEIKLSKESCITAFPGFIEIHPYPGSSKKVKINIDGIASQKDYFTSNDSQNKQFREMFLGVENLKLFGFDNTNNTSNYLCKITNGVIYVIVNKTENSSVIDFTCTIFDIKTGKLLRRVKLHKNQQQENNKCNLYRQWDFDPLLPEMFPNLQNYNSIPIETNGTTISFIFEVQNEIAIYRTFSLITGEFLNDEQIMLNTEESIIATSIDSLNNCRWILTKHSNNKVYLRKMYYKSSVDPYIFNINDIIVPETKSDFLVVLNNLLKHFCCSPNPPSFLLCKNIEQFRNLVEILTKSINEYKDKLFIQTLCLLISLNTVNNEEFCTEIRSIMDIVNSNEIEIGLKFLLFIPSFSSFLKVAKKESISILFDLYSIAKSTKEFNILLISYTLKVLERCSEFATLSIKSIRDIQSRIESESFLPLFIVHQHVLIQNLISYIENDNLIENQTTRGLNGLVMMTDYITQLIPIFIGKLDEEKNKNEEKKNTNEELIKTFPDKMIYKLFHNILYLLVPLSSNHLVSHQGMNALTTLLRHYTQIHDSIDSLKMGLLETCYIYCMFLSSLVSGGELSSFDKKYLWIVQSNLDLLKNNEMIQNLSQEIKGNEFLESKDYTLDYLYSQIKKQFNKNITEEIRKLDKTVLLAISQHMNCYEELISICNATLSPDGVKISQELRQSFIQMQRVRDSYRRLQQQSEKEANYNNFLEKSYMLIKIKSTTLLEVDAVNRAKIFGDFILSPYSLEHIKGFLIKQKNRNTNTLVGFALANATFKFFEEDKNKQLESVVGHVMNKYLTNFEGLNSIVSMKGNYQYTSQEKNDINEFFDNIYPTKNNQAEKTFETRIIPYRFFKCIKVFPDILENFLSNILGCFDQHLNDPGFYAFTVSLIKLMGNLPIEPFQSQILSLIKTTINTYKLSLIEHMLQKINDDFTFNDEFIKLFFEDSLFKSPIDIKIIMRIRYLLTINIRNDNLDNYLKGYLLFIGDHLNDTNRYYSFLVTELITLLRKIYLLILQDQNSPLRNDSLYLLLMNSISNTNNDNENVALSLCAIFGFQMETIFPYSVIKVCLNEDISQLYLLIQNNNNDNNNNGDDIFDAKTCVCYPLPFDVLSETQKYQTIKEKSFITVEPEINYTNVVFADKIKNMLMSSQMLSFRYKIFPVCAQALLHFYTISEPKIITDQDQELIKFMCSKITYFHDIYYTFNKIKSLQSLLKDESKQGSLQILPEASPEFGILQDRSSVTLLSFQIKTNAPKFIVNIEILDNKNVIVDSKEDLFHFGIISDSFEEEELRMSTVGFPTGINFPEMKKVCDLENNKNQPNSNKNSFNLSFIVNISDKKFSVNSSEVDFPIGRRFRIIIFTKKENQFEFKPTFAVEDQMDASKLIFDFGEPPDLDKIISTKRKPEEKGFEDFDFLELPDFIEDMSFGPNEVLKEDYHQYPTIDRFSHDMELSKKLKLVSLFHPMNPVLHLYKALGASKQIIEHHLNGLYLKLGRQWITVLLMKIAINDPSLISSHAFELFATLSIPLESFNQAEFEQDRFPFSLDNPPWKSLTMSSILEDKNKSPNFNYLSTNEMKVALSSIIKNPACMEQIAEGLVTMSSSTNLHLIALPQKFHSFLQLKEINLNRQSIVSFNNFEGSQKDAVYVNDDGKKKVYYDLPLIFKNKSNDSDFGFLMTQLIIDNNDKNQVSVLGVNDINNVLKNDWVIDTPIELLIHLKNFALATKNERHHALIKTILIDLYLGKSPFAIPFINQFQDFVQMKCSANLFYKDETYMKHLVALAGYLNSVENPDDQYVFLYENEQRMMSTKFSKNDAALFREFFPKKIEFPEPTTDSIMIPYEPIDPGLIKEGFQSRIIMIRYFFQNHDSIVNLPFWEILPLWNKLIENFGYDSGNRNENYISEEVNNSVFLPKITQVNENVKKITNTSSRNFNVVLEFKRKMTPNDSSFLKNSIFQYSFTEDFENSNFIDYTNYDKPIIIGKGDTYFSFILGNYRDPWKYLCKLKIEQINKKGGIFRTSSDSNKDHPVKITEEYKREFIRSMKSFVLDWTPKHTEILLNMFTIEQLKSPSFELISQIVLDSELSKIFPKSVLLLRAVLIHQFSYIRYQHNKLVSEYLWNSCSNLVPIIEKSSVLQAAISKNDKRSMIEINRRASYILIDEFKQLNPEINNNDDELVYIPNREQSIISQFSQKTKAIRMECMRGVRPFSTRFTGEDGIDAGGITKELLREVASSAFQPSSQLFTKANCKEEYFIPETRKRNAQVKKDVILNEYFTIGVLIGLISRSGFPQYFPLAPFIWKYIAGEIITPDDIAEVDRDFKTKVENVRKKLELPSWEATNWINDKDIVLLQTPDSIAIAMSSVSIDIEDNNNKEEEEEINDDDVIERYLNEYTKYRVNLLNPMLNKIREGFIANTELFAHPMLCGKVLSFLVQGSSDISTAQLKEITIINGNSAKYSKTLDIFWDVVSEFTDEQRRLLLKFITGITRIPKIFINESDSFRIIIQFIHSENILVNPNSQLPTSLACFNKLNLPLYTDKEAAKSKILFAIENCVTMENQ